MKSSQKLEPLLYSIFTLVILAYLVLRAINAGLVNDEGFTFFRYISSNRPIPLIFGGHISANNHILNSLLSWCTFKLFGISEWTIRLPNLLSFVLYAYSVYYIARYLSQKYLRVLFWLLAFGAHYYLEFFAYSRGYGLSIALLATSLLLLLKSEEPKNICSLKHLWFSFILISLGTLANLNLLPSLLIWSIPAFFQISKKQVKLIRKTIMGLIYLLAVAGFMMLALVLKNGDHLSFGQNDLRSFIQSLLIEFAGSNSPVALWVFSIFVIIVSVLSLWFLAKLPFKTLNGFQVFGIFFLLNIAGIVAMHYLLGVNYPLGRTGFQVYFLFICTLPFLIDQMGKTAQAIAGVATLLLFAPMFWFTLKVSNLYYSSNEGWREQQISDNFFYQIEELNQQSDSPLSLYASDNFYTVNLAFKNLKLGGNLQTCMNEGPGNLIPSSDLLIMKEERFPEYTQWYQSVYYDDKSGMSLMKRNPILETAFIADSVTLPNSSSSRSFTSIGNFNLQPSLVGKPIRLNFNAHLKSQESPFLALITVEVWDSTQQIDYEQINLDYYQDDISDGYHFQSSVIFDQLSPQAQKIKCYIWNLGNEPFEIIENKIALHQLIPPQKKTSSHPQGNIDFTLSL